MAILETLFHVISLCLFKLFVRVSLLRFSDLCCFYSTTAVSRVEMFEGEHGDGRWLVALEIIEYWLGSPGRPSLPLTRGGLGYSLFNFAVLLL